MVTLVWRTDAHLADTPPSSRTDDWAATICGKLEQIGEIAREVSADAVIDGGDFYHIKSPSRTTHALNQRIAEIHAKYPCPTFCNVGNHDVKYGEIRYLSEAPLGVLFASGVFRRLYDQHEALIERGGIKVRVVGVPYHGVKYDLARIAKAAERGDETYLVVAAHLLASKAGGEMFESEDILKYGDLPEGPDLWMLGHWHKDQGVTALDDRRSVVNIGSLSRGALTMDETTRTPSVAVLRFFDNTVEVEVRPLEVQPAEKVFDITGRIRAESRKMTADSFIESIRESLKVTPEKSLLDTVREQPDVPELVRERAILYLEQST